jgi:acetyl esterase
MARIDPRLRVWGWLTRRMVSIATMSDAEVIALQARRVPANPVTNWLFGTAAPEVDVTDRSVPGPAGDLKARVYRPAAAAIAGTTAGRPLVVYIHGGGFALGGLDMGNWVCGSVAASVGAVVVSVDYRLAPSHVFPAAVEDCYAALAWAAENGVPEPDQHLPVGVPEPDRVGEDLEDVLLGQVGVAVDHPAGSIEQ